MKHLLIMCSQMKKREGTFDIEDYKIPRVWGKDGGIGDGVSVTRVALADFFG